MATRLKSVWVDLNSRRGGYVPAHLDDADSPLTVGDAVYAWDEFEEGLRAPATVVEIDQEAGIALLDVDWGNVQRDDDTAAVQARVDRMEPLEQPVSETGFQHRVRESHQVA